MKTREVIFVFIAVTLSINFALANHLLTNVGGEDLRDWLYRSTPPKHNRWDALLQKYVSAQGRVNYKALAHEKQQLDEYCRQLSETKVSKQWTKEEKISFWANAYNAFTVQLIIENYPIKSIMDLDGGKTWNVPRISIDSKKYSLNDIEHQILRKLGEPRIHFLLNCASKSCPILPNTAITPTNVHQLLEQQTKIFITSNHNQIKENEIHISMLFKWYATDFGDLIAFINRYSVIKVSSKATINYRAYDWTLNE